MKFSFQAIFFSKLAIFALLYVAIMDCRNGYIRYHDCLRLDNVLYINITTFFPYIIFQFFMFYILKINTFIYGDLVMFLWSFTEIYYGRYEYLSIVNAVILSMLISSVACLFPNSYIAKTLYIKDDEYVIVKEDLTAYDGTQYEIVQEEFERFKRDPNIVKKMENVDRTHLGPIFNGEIDKFEKESSEIMI